MRGWSWIALLFFLAAAYGETQSASFAKHAAQADAARKTNAPQAAGLYTRALALRPSWQEGWWALGSLQYEKDRYPQCRDAFRRLTVLEVKSGPAFAMLGLCEFGAK